MGAKSDPGKDAERKAHLAIELLMGEGNEIVSFHHSKSGGEVDSLHTDFLIFLRSGLIFPLQVKCSPKGARKHFHKYPYISVIVVGRRKKVEDVARHIKSLINRQYRRIRQAV